MNYQANHRYIIIDKDISDSVLLEVKCLEVSPAGRVKLEFQGRHHIWTSDLSRYPIVEELP